MGLKSPDYQRYFPHREAEKKTWKTLWISLSYRVDKYFKPPNGPSA